jgi:hypothetical protein
MIATLFTRLYKDIILKGLGFLLVDEFIPMNEADTCRSYILPKLRTAYWDNDVEYFG